MRDIAITAFVVGSLPFILKRPWIGALMWVWLSVMNPHRLTWSFAYDMQFAQMVAVATLVGILFWKGHKHLPMTATTVTLLLLFAWMHVSLVFAINFIWSLRPWETVVKTFLMFFVILYLLHTKQHVRWLVLIVTVSIAFYGVKGGRFTLLGGGERVYGPAGSLITENNALAVAVIMTIPLLRYWQLQTEKLWLKLAIVPAMLLCAVSAFGSQSRGALLAIVATTAFLWVKSRNKVITLLLIAIVAPLIWNFMPDTWHRRMATIETYDEDSSAMGRLDAWQGAINLANSRPTGGGFEIYYDAALGQYTPSGTSRAAHSIWFAMLGEHGWPGLFLFALLWFFAWRDGNWIIARCGKRKDLAWAADMARMIQVSLLAYCVGGALLQLHYFDGPYYLAIALVLTRQLIAKEVGETKAWYTRAPSPAGSSGPLPAGTAPGAAPPVGLASRPATSAMPWPPPRSG